jgi:phosphoglycolate phosphatase-like HAD superfamily hydrolase
MKDRWRVGLDLDGTLIDTRVRHEMALCRAAAGAGVELPEAFPIKYYDQKCAGFSGSDVLLRNGIPQAKTIAENWIRIIEDADLLRLDSPFPSVFDKLQRLSKDQVDFFVCTSRQHRDRVLRQFVDLGLNESVKEIFVAETQLGVGRGLSKASLTKHLDLRIVIGDSEVDAEWAAELKARFVAVSCGARSAKFWAQRGVIAHPDTLTALEEVFDILGSGRKQSN